MARSYVEELHDGVKRRAAEALGVDYQRFFRFLREGKASPESRQEIRAALQAAEWNVTKDLKISHPVSLEATRSMLTQLLEALDAYQSSATSSKGDTTQ